MTQVVSSQSLILALLLCSSFALNASPRATHQRRIRASPQLQEEQDKNHQDLIVPLGDVGRRRCLLSVSAAITGILLPPCLAAVRADENVPTSISACAKSSDAGAPANCVSTASVRNVDLYAPPWTIPEGMSPGEAMARIKGAISMDKSLTIRRETDTYLKVAATRSFNNDELEFLINPVDNVITFRSQQVDGPSVPDFGANRKRLDNLRKSARVFGVMGEEFETADAAPREGALDQLKAFYGLRSGQGYEDVVLER